MDLLAGDVHHIELGAAHIVGKGPAPALRKGRGAQGEGEAADLGAVVLTDGQLPVREDGDAAVQGGEAVGGGGLVADGAAAGARAVGEVAAQGVKARAVPPGGQGHHAQNRRQHREEDQKAPEAPVLRPFRPAALRREGLTSFIH